MSLSGGNTEALIARLIEAGTPAALVAEVAMELARAAASQDALESRRKHERDRKARSREVTGQTVTGRDRADKPPKVSPKNNIQTPSSPPVEVSEASASSPQPRAWSLPTGVSLQVWNDLLSNRKRKRLGNTDTAWEQFLGDVERVSSQTGIPPPELIRRCAAKGWGAIYDPREAKHGTAANHSGGKSAAAFAMLNPSPTDTF